MCARVCVCVCVRVFLFVCVAFVLFMSYGVVFKCAVLLWCICFVYMCFV